MSGPPNGWEAIEASQICRFVRGVSYDKSAARSEPAEGYVGILRATNIQDNQLNRSDLVYVPAEFVSADQYLQPGDILIATSSGSKEVVGKAAMATSAFTDCAFGAFCSVARPLNRDCSSWLSHFTKSKAYRSYVESVALGININNFRTSDLSALPLAIAPGNEQRRIVAKLGSLHARSARARHELDRIPKLAERYKQAILAKAFAGELTADWRSQHREPNSLPVLLDAYRRAVRRELIAPTNADGLALNPLPAGWIWLQAQDVVAPDADIVYGIVQPGPKLEIGVPYVRGMDIQNGEILVEQLMKTSPAIAQRYSRAALRCGDVLLGIIRDTKVAIVPKGLDGANITQGTSRLRPASFVRPKYLAHWLRTEFAQKWLHDHYRGIDMPGLNLRDVRRCPVPVAPPLEQDEIVHRLASSFMWIERVAAEHGRAEHLLPKLDQAILAKAFRGELVPQDPNDEPASKLLERIRHARGDTPPASSQRRPPRSKPLKKSTGKRSPTPRSSSRSSRSSHRRAG